MDTEATPSYEELQRVNAEQALQIEKLSLDLEKALNLLVEMKRQKFGRKSERLDVIAGQQFLFPTEAPKEDELCEDDEVDGQDAPERVRDESCDYAIALAVVRPGWRGQTPSDSALDGRPLRKSFVRRPQSPIAVAANCEQYSEGTYLGFPNARLILHLPSFPIFPCAPFTLVFFLMGNGKNPGMLELRNEGALFFLP